MRRASLLAASVAAAVTAGTLSTLGAAPAAAAGCATSCVVAPGVELADAAFATPTQGWIVGTGGYIATTEDGGLTWQLQNSGVSADLRAIDFADASTGLAVGANETVLRTTDGGATWTRDNPGFGADLRDVDFVDATRGWIAGVERVAPYGNFIARTDDGGLTWSKQQSLGGIGLVEVSFADRNHGFTHGSIDPAYRTDDGGQTWQQMNVTTSIQYLYAMRRVSPTRGVAGGGFGELLRTTDSGLTWSKAVWSDGSPAALGRPIRAIASLGSRVIAVGEGGVGAISEDDGATWKRAGTATTAHFYGAAIASPTLAIAVGQIGFVSRMSGTPEPPTRLDLADHYADCAGVTLSRRLRAAGTGNHAAVGDIDGSGVPSVVLSSFGGIRAVRPFTTAGSATMWSLDLAVRVQRSALAELDGDAGREVVAITAVAPATRQGVLALDGATGAVLWSAQVSGGATRLQVADLDADGDDDVIVGGLGATLYVLDGATGAQLRPSRGLDRVVTDIAVADITGDGRPDIVVSDEGGGTAAIDGPTGTLLWEHATSVTTRAVTTADLTGDGVEDVVVGGSGIRESRFNGTGDFRYVVGNNAGILVVALDGRTGRRIWDYGQSTSGSIDALAIADFNRDGTPDVVAHSSRIEYGHLVALDGRGDQSSPLNAGEPLELWTLPTTWKGTTSGQSASSPDALTTHDGNSDGIPDVYAGLDNGALMAVSGAVPPRVGLTDNAGTATVLWADYRDASVRAVPLLANGDQTYAVGVSSDGLVAARDAGTGTAEWSFDAGGPMEAVGGDVDADGVDDLATGSVAGRVTSYAGDGAFRPALDEFLPHGVVRTVLLDIDGDGVPEVIAADRNKVVSAFDTRSGMREWTATVDSRPTALAAGAGVVTVGTGTGKVVGLDAATGAARWTTQIVSPGMITHVAFAAGPDVFAAGTTNGQLTILTPAGSAAVGRPMPGLVDGVTAADLDGDGAQEFAVAAGNNVEAVRPNGDLIWSFSATSPAFEITTDDFTGDGVDDVLAAGHGAAVALNGRTGALLFTRSVLLSAGIAGLDLEGDGPAEAVVTSTDRDTYTQLSVVSAGGTLRAACVFDTGVGDLASGDYDGDGHSEVVITTIDGDIYLLTPTVPRTSKTKPPVELATTLTFTPESATTGEYSDTVSLVARLVDAGGAPVVGAIVDLTLASADATRTFRATTDDDGVALRQAMLVDPPGSYTLKAAYAGSPDRYGASAAETPFTLAQEQTSLTLSLQGKSGHRELVAVLRDHDNVDAPLAGRTIEFSAGGVAIGSAVTDAAGVARINPTGRFGGGKHLYVADFAGDDRYLASTDSRQA